MHTHTHTRTHTHTQVQSAPDVEHPELKSHPRDTSEGDGITIQSREDSNNQWTRDDGVGGAEEDMDVDSPRAGVKMSFGVRSKTGGNGSNDTPTRKRAVETNVLGEEEEGDADTPKRKLASIQQIEREQRDEKKVLEREVNRMALKYSGEDRKKIPPEEKKKMIQALVKGIPTSKEELFEYELKWEAIDQVHLYHVYVRIGSCREYFTMWCANNCCMFVLTHHAHTITSK